MPLARRAALAALVMCGSMHAEAQDWAGFRGPDSAPGPEATRLLVGFDKPSLLERWSAPVGSGYSGVAVLGGRVFTAFAAASGEDVVAAFDEKDGRLLWRQTLDATYKGHDGSHDGPISTPAADAQRVYALSPRGILTALGVQDGASRWRVDLAAIAGTAKPYYGHASSPLLAGPCVVVQQGVKDKQSVSCFDRTTGSLLWSAGRHEVAYQSPVLATLHGETQIVAADAKRLYGLAPADGRVLWDIEFETDNSPQGAGSAVPLVIEGNRILLTHRGDSSALYEVKREGETWSAGQLWVTKGLRGSYNRPVHHDGHFYGYAGAFLTCVRVSDGEQVWRSRAPGDGFLTVVGGRLVVQTKLGALHLAEVSPAGYKEIAHVQAMPDHSWTAPTYAGGHLYARGMSRLVKIGLGSAASPRTASLAVDALPTGPRLAAAIAAIEKATDKPAAVEAFLSGVSTFPLVEGDIVQFLYRGPGQDLGIVGEMIGQRQQRAMVRVAGTDLFYWSARVHPQARLLYRFVKDFDENLVDPRNPRTESQPAPAGDMSWFAMPGWREPVFLAEVPEAQRGRLVRHEIEGAKTTGKRTVDVYLPSGYDGGTARYPVAYVHGGPDALERGQLARVLDNLLANGRVKPLIAVFVAPQGTGPQTGAELVGDKRDAYADSVAEDVVAFVDATYRTRADRSARACVGGGSGAYAAAYATFKRGDVFGRVAAQSIVGITVHLDALLGQVRKAESLPVVASFEWSQYDSRAEHEGWNMADNGKAVVAELDKRGVKAQTREVQEGHSWGSWRNRADLVFGSLFADLS